jgi:TBC1 domain family protein 5
MMICVQRNLPDLTASLGRTSPPMHSVAYAAFPLSNEKPPEERPPWEPRTRFEMERDISEMRSMNKRLGKSVGWIVDALLQDEDDIRDAEQFKSIQLKKREALESLAYVRDILNGGVTSVEDERLWSGQAFERKSMEETRMPLEKRDSSQIDKPQPVAPIARHSIHNAQRPSSSPPQEHSRFRTSLPTSSPVNRSLHSPSGSVSPLSQDLTTPRPSAPMAPWHSSPSGFSGTSIPISPTLPRIPPPTSTTYQIPRIPSPGSGQVEPPHVLNKSLEVQRDPLGVL